jgi:flagellin-like hook-associated protein FlgL
MVRFLTRKVTTMAIGGVTLSVGLRNGLSSLNRTNEAIDQSNFRLSTGKKVNSALDNAVSFFTAQSLTDRASTFSTIQDNIKLGMRTFETATEGLNKIKSLLESAQGQIRSAQQTVGTNVKIVSSQSYVNATTGRADPTALVAGTGVNDISIGDNFTIALAGGVTVAATPVIAAPVTGTTTVQNILDGINNNVTLNPTTASPRVRAYLNDAGNIVVESTRSDVNVTLAQSANGGGANTLSGTFTVTGDPNATQTTTGLAGAQSIATLATTNTSRAAAAAVFKTTMDQIGQLARDAGFNGINLLNGDSLRIAFNDSDTTSLTTRGVTANAGFFGFATDNPATFTGDSVYNFQSDREMKLAFDKLTTAVTRVRDQQAQISSNLTIVKARSDFTGSLVKSFDQGADDLVGADINQEGANLTALQTRQALAVQALSLASQSDQAILRLF